MSKELDIGKVVKEDIFWIYLVNMFVFSYIINIVYYS